MDVAGKVRDGVVVLDGGVKLPEGAVVRVLFPVAPRIHVAAVRRRVQLPLVKTGRPGSVSLSNERIAEILEVQDIDALNKPAKG